MGVPHAQKLRVDMDAAVPEAVQQLQPPVGRGGHRVDHLHAQAALPRVGRQQAAEPQQLVVRVADQQHDVRLVGLRPFRGARRAAAGLVDRQLRQHQPRAVPVLNPRLPGSLGEGHPLGEVGAAVGNLLPGVALPDLHRAGRGAVIVLQEHAAHGLALAVDLDDAAGAQGQVGLVLAVAQLGQLLLAGQQVHIHALGDVLGLMARRPFRAGAPRKAGQQASRQQPSRQPSFPIHSVTVLCHRSITWYRPASP